MRSRRRPLTAKLSLLTAVTAVVCLAQFPRPSDSDQYAAKVVTMVGQVSVLRDTVLFGLTDGASVQVQEMIVTGPDGHATFQVSDGSTFEVFPNSHLVFRKNAWNPKDFIDLLVGRIRVHIEHFGNVPNPNHVLTPTAVISVRGTTFDVTVDDNDETTTVEVEDGLVEVRHALLPSENMKRLGPGETLKVYKNQPIAQSGIDKGRVFQFVLRAVQDAANVASIRITHGALGVGGGGSSSTSGDAGKAAPPPPPSNPLPTNHGHFVDSGPTDANTTATAPHRTAAEVIRATAKRALVWLGKVSGITPAFAPMSARLMQ
jgi:hypothetical protein